MARAVLWATAFTAAMAAVASSLADLVVPAVQASADLAWAITKASFSAAAAAAASVMAASSLVVAIQGSTIEACLLEQKIHQAPTDWLQVP